MKVFNTAYLRLTAWYVAIIMAISLLFSIWVYRQAQTELRLGFTGIEANLPSTATKGVSVSPVNYKILWEEQLKDAQNRLIMRLTLLNLGVLVVGSAASYWLARRTMQPIEESVIAQERFTADASHELRTPLAAMKTEIEVGLRDSKITKDEAVALLKSNLEEIDRLGGLADGLLALTQSDASLAVTPIDLDAVTAKTIKRMASLAKAKQLEIEQDLQPARILGDEMAVDKIIGILLDNAIKYSPAHSTITLQTIAAESQAFLTVSDQGIGIKASELPHIFDRFYRADTSRSKQHVAGNGLGLSIAQKLADNLGGTIAATSKPGQGSSFTVTFKKAD